MPSIALRSVPPYLAVAVVAAGGLFAGTDAAGAAVPGWTPRTHLVPKAEGPITIDGVLDEPAWSSALRLPLEWEVQPGENVPPPVETEILLLWDAEAFYFACRCYDGRPERIRARLADRDEAMADDWIGFMVDTFDDSRRGYEFVVNPLGVQFDALNDDIGGNYDDNWNAIWESAGRLTDDGYRVEVRVPYHQLRFPDVDGPLTWGFDSFRSVPRVDRHHIGLWPRDRGSSGYIVQADDIVGMDEADAGRNLEIVPTVTARAGEARADFPEGDFDDTDSEVDAGVTARWGITPNVSLLAAINPDFSQVEADALQLDLNEQFALFFPETRPFFQEEADFFDTASADLVYTRNVADPDLAGKVSGKVGAHAFGVFTSRDAVTHLVLPGVERSATASFDFESTASVARYRRDFGTSSTVGGLVTDRRGGGYSSGLAAADLNWRPSPEDTVAVVLAASSTDYGREVADRFGLDETEADGHLALVDYRHRGRSWGWKAIWREIDEGFRADLGFQPRVGTTFANAGFDYRLNPEQGGFLRQGRFGFDWDRTDDVQDDFEEEWEAWLGFDLPLQATVEFGGGIRDRRFRGVDYDQDFVWFEGRARPLRSLFVSVDLVDWDDVDFRHERAAERDSWTLRLESHLGRRVRGDVEFERQRLDVAGGRLFTAETTEIRAVYQHSTRTFVRAILQRVFVERDPTLHLDAVDRETDSLFAQLLFSYKLNPRTVVFLGYSDNGLGTQDFERTTTDRTLFLKLGYSFVR